jgi:isoquinoline 1-oxidoreductase beta subunit
MPFTLKPEILLKDRTGAWYAAHPSWTSDQTLGINVSIDGISVLVTRRSTGSSANASRAPLSGRITDMPEFAVHIVPSADPPTGMVEPGLPPLTPAFANAIAQLTGKPLRQLPFALA